MDTQRAKLREQTPHEIAWKSGARWEASGEHTGTLRLTYLQMPLEIHVPEYRIVTRDDNALPTITEALIIAYLVTANGTPRAGEWIAFRELPDGLFYHQAFTGYTGYVLAKMLGNNLEAFVRGAKANHGGRLTGFGDAAFEFQVLPKLWLAVVYWLGDEQDGFPAQANVLFDKSASEYLITDGLAILAGQLTRRILSAARG